MTGGCLCGRVRFEIAAPLGTASYCHCTRCQRRTGTGASAQARLKPGRLKIVQGADLVRGWRPPDGMVKEFCGECGAHLWSRDPATREIFAVRLGAIDGDPGVRPSVRSHTESAAPWEPIPADDPLERFSGSAWSSGEMGTM